MLDQNADHLLVDLRLLLPQLVSNALHVLAAIVILVVGFWVARRAQILVVRSLDRAPHLDSMLKGFFSNIIRYFVLTITVLAVLSQFGIRTTSLVAVLGAAGLAIGLALQGTLSHLAAGVMLLIFRPFRTGQHVQIGGTDGTVKELSLFWTELVTSDNVQVIIPNGSVWGQQLLESQRISAAGWHHAGSLSPAPAGTWCCRGEDHGHRAGEPQDPGDPGAQRFAGSQRYGQRAGDCGQLRPGRRWRQLRLRSRAEIIAAVYDALEAEPANVQAAEPLRMRR